MATNAHDIYNYDTDGPREGVTRPTDNDILAEMKLASPGLPSPILSTVTACR